MAAERKSESAATSAVQVSQDNKAFPLDESEEIMTSSGWKACLIMYDQVELMQLSAVPTSLSLSQGSTDKLRKKNPFKVGSLQFVMQRILSESLF